MAIYKQSHTLFQGWVFVMSVSLGHIFLLPHRVISASGADSWIAVLIGYAIVLAGSLLTFLLLNQYPQQSFVSVLQQLLGRFLGKALAGVLIAGLWMFSALELRETSDSFKVFMEKTPIFWLSFTLTILLVYLLYKGFAVLIYLTEFFTLIIAAALCLLIILNINNTHWNQLLPIMDRELPSLLKGVFQQVIFGIQALVVVSILLPKLRLSNSENKKAVAFGFLAVGLLFSFVVAGLVALSGHKFIGIQTFPIFYLSRVIIIGDFLTGFETYSTFTWLTSKFIQLGSLYFASIIGLSEIVGLEKYKLSIIPIAAAAFVVSMLPRDYLEVLKYIQQGQLLLFMLFAFLLLLIFSAHLIRRRAMRG